MKIVETITNVVAQIIKKFILSSIYRTAEGGDERSLDKNTVKHAQAFLLSLLVIPGTVLAVLYGGEKAEAIVMYVSLAAQIAGLAWFVVTFAALPQRHLHAALITTRDMFCAFLGGIIALIIWATMTAPVSLLVIGPIYVWMYRAAVLYDSADLLKAGKDEQEVKAAKATQRMELVLALIAKEMGVDFKDTEGE